MRILGGEMVPTYHLIPGAVGAVDEVNVTLGLTMASSDEKKSERILLYIQKNLCRQTLYDLLLRGTGILA